MDPAYRNRPVMEALLQAYFLYYQELMQTLPCQVEDVLCDTVTPEGAHLARRLGLSPFGSSNHQSQVFFASGPCFFSALEQEDSVKVFSQKQIWPFGSRQSTGYDIRQQIILCF